MAKDFSKRLYVGITGWTDKHWKDKLKEIKNFGITEAALFLERFDKRQRREIYKALEESDIKRIPLVHIKNDMRRAELEYLCKRYKFPYLTIHEDSFNYLKKWRGFYKNLYLEMNYNNSVPEQVDVSRIGGFCVDLSHFKSAEEKWAEEFLYTLKRSKVKKYFKCNHLNGYSYKKNRDMHDVKSLRDFAYLKTLPEFVFGEAIGIETNNCIKDQLRFKKYLTKMLNGMF